MPITRRRMLMVSLGSSALLATGLAVRWQRPAVSSMTRRGRALGTDITLTVQCDSTQRAEQALQAAFDELERVEQIMSLYRPGSQVCQLNQTGQLADPHPDLREVLTTAHEVSRMTDGAFDVTVQPLWELSQRCRQAGRSPERSEVETARQMVDWRGVAIQPDSIQLRSPVRAITLNGIAQGFAADRILSTLRAHGIEQALVNAGEIGSLGHQSAREPWTAGLQHPRQPDEYSAVVALDGRSLATSGDYATTFTDDFSRNHLFDPHTGASPQELASVSIVAPTGLQADAMSTAAMVLGVERTLELVARLPDVDAFLVLKSGRTLHTQGFPCADAV